MLSSRPFLRSPAAALGIAVALAGSALLIGERLAVPGGGAGRAGPVLPGVTVADDEAAMPVVTSLRSDGEAERAGLRVGDRIDRIDGRPVRDVASLARAVAAGPDRVALRIRRGDALWTVAIDRAEPAPNGTRRHDPQDIAG